MSDETTREIWFHGTSAEAAERIGRQGFREQFLEDDGSLGQSGGNLGVGVYVSSSWRVALWFGRVLLRVSLSPGTRILNATVSPDGDVLRYLKREFGRDVLRRPPLKVLPANKQLTRPELEAVFRHHYREAWVRPWRRPRDPDRESSRREALSFELLAPYRSLLARHGYHGYGDPGDENGVVVFAGDRVVLEEVVAQLPAELHGALCRTIEMPELESLDQVRARFA